ncbi:hypothetical protein AB0I28_12475 [Phytomonospora sp. NPDC050363]|uniref:hypothetical protein n=1 Tax=Phytomonospora sp. NPDC050363 TaxID=3155642 RepID=UPI0034053045
MDAVIARELPYNPDAGSKATRKQYTAKTTTALAAAFRERAEHAVETCDVKWFSDSYDPLLSKVGVDWGPCVECDELADRLTKWADEIEASRSAGPTEEISNEA